MPVTKMRLKFTKDDMRVVFVICEKVAKKNFT